jgi:molybdate transport system substrate-binding protein
MRWVSFAAKVTLAFLLLASAAQAAEIKVMSSAGFAPAYRELAADFERKTGNTIDNAWGPSMGDTPQAIPNRLARGEPVDVLIKQGKVVASSRVDLAQAPIVMAVRAGAPKPDISTVEAFKRTLLNAKSIAYSDSASGVYLSTVVFPRLGIADQIKDKSRTIPADPVGGVVASGDAEIGFQQKSEMIPIKGIDIVGPIPAEIQKVTVFSAGISITAQHPVEGRALIKFLSSPSAASVITKTGMYPMAAAARN